jgi:hypothetical protein
MPIVDLDLILVLFCRLCVCIECEVGYEVSQRNVAPFFFVFFPPVCQTGEQKFSAKKSGTAHGDDYILLITISFTSVSF